MKPERNKPPPKALRDVWAKVPKMIGCDGRCERSCGPIPVTPLERRVVERVAGKAIDVVPGTLDCTLLVKGRCCAYTARPLICRLWGATEGMPCVFGCKPERMLSKDEAHALMAEVIALERPADPAEHVDAPSDARKDEHDRRHQQNL